MEEHRNNTETVGDEDEELWEEGEEDESNDALKRTISAHPLYGKLVKVHLDCLKIGDWEIDHHEKGKDLQQPMNKILSSSKLQQSDLDQFMESYCAALSKLREAIEAPHRESMAFITNMHSRIQDIAQPRNNSDAQQELITEDNCCKLV